MGKRLRLFAGAIMLLGMTGYASQEANPPASLAQASLNDIQQLQDGQLTSEELINYYLQRIDALNKQGPELNPVISLNPKVIDEARQADRARLAGAIILGKANLSEWANFRSTRSSSGWSGIGGQTRNPYNPSTSTCGSSSGSAVAIAADLVTLAMGTETDGSVTCPSAINGIVGIKPPWPHQCGGVQGITRRCQLLWQRKIRSHID
ncbi:hypothetical protein LZP69_15725 [Shewanella sp. AS1]|uniref:amidase family protein n=1 Tax=Shewanella sp. AS1 TaxID=2907626 RepID=UPI001EEE2DAF|nr:amidase family protein [Shewanella sp. AS1]MCE9680601.1 hypothetical protein [Shewanella sp. AS1]